MCLAGGSVAEGALDRIALAALPWPQVHIVWADERAVPLSSAESNAGQAMRRWSGTPMAAASVHPMVHPMVGDASDLDTAALDYERQLIELLGDAPVIDFALLGVGADGHIASLFPGRPSLEESCRLVLVEPDSPKPPPLRARLRTCKPAATDHAVAAISCWSARGDRRGFRSSERGGHRGGSIRSSGRNSGRAAYPLGDERDCASRRLDGGTAGSTTPRMSADSFQGLPQQISAQTRGVVES